MKRDPTKRMLALARQLDRRECFADSIDGLNAHVIFGMLLDEREAAQPPAVDEATAQLTPPKDAGEHPDTKRLNFLDSLNAALNKHYGTKYLWKMITSHNVNRLMLPNFQVDLNDAVAHGLPSCRAAIDEKMREHERTLAQANRKGGVE